MTDSPSSIPSPVNNPPTGPTPESEHDIPITPPQESGSLSEALSPFSDYIEQYPNRVPSRTIKALSVLGIMVVGSLAGVLLIKQNADIRQQASEGSKTPKICVIKDTQKLSETEINNSTNCLLDGKTYYSCNDGFSFDNGSCILNSL